MMAISATSLKKKPLVYRFGGDEGGGSGFTLLRFNFFSDT
jgi:hypothetical protein